MRGGVRNKKGGARNNARFKPVMLRLTTLRRL